MSTQSLQSDEGGRTTAEASPRWKPLRIWPAAVLIAGMILCRYLPTILDNGVPNIWIAAAMGPALCGIAILLWWIAASRATWRERVAGLLGIVAIAVITVLLIDKTMRGPAVLVLTIPLGTAAFGLGAIVCGRMLSFRRTVAALLFAAVGFSVSLALRSDGVWGNFSLGLHARWIPSQEDLLLQGEKNRPAADVTQVNFAEALKHAEWPEFRGPARDSQQHGPQLATDWKADPPEQLWKIAVGPAWSSFAVAGPLLFTQEQRGAFETVVCYKADSGREIWTRQNESRFDDPLGGPGPRGTPTLSGGALYVMGATGWLLKLDPQTGEVLWQKDLRQAADREPPMWGFASSPLVVDSVVIVHAGGKEDKGILAFDTADGKLRWSAAAGDHSYSSPQLATLGGEPCVLMLTNAGLNVLDPTTGDSRLNYDWKTDNYRALQPQLVGDDRILLPTPMTGGTSCIRVSDNAGKLAAKKLWTSRNLKPDFNDLVVYQGHAYGFDGALFTCIDLATGDRDWKGGRYGKGQVLLQAESGLLLVATEVGEVVLLKADPKSSQELGRFQAVEGKTWNHPVLVGDRLYVRNAEQAACYRLPLAKP
jgi:hypothetical protein